MLYNQIGIQYGRKVAPFLIWTFIFLLAFFSYWPLFFQEPFWDDSFFIFNNSDLLNAPSPFVFWDPSSRFTKAWPMGYSFLWLLQKTVGISAYVLHIVCFLLHFLNGFLIYLMTKRFLKKMSYFLAVFFIFHPVHVLTLSWVIQIFSVLSLTFFLVAIYFLLRIDFTKSIRSRVLGLLFFGLSFATKPWLLLSSIFYFKQLIKLELNWKLTFVVIFLMSSVGYFYYKSRQGVHLRYIENKNEPYYYFDLNSQIRHQNQFIEEPTYFHGKVLFDSSNRVDLNLGQKVMMKLITIGNSFYFYLEKTFLVGKQTVIYPKKSYADYKTILGALMLVFLFIISALWFLELVPAQYWFLGFSSFLLLVTYLPVSGVIYIPQMKFNLVSDHWYYMQAFGFGSLLAALMQIAYIKFKWSPYLFLLFIPLFLFGYYKNYSYVRYFSNRVQMLEDNLKINPNSVIVQELLRIEQGSVSK